MKLNFTALVVPVMKLFQTMCSVYFCYEVAFYLLFFFFNVMKLHFEINFFSLNVKLKQKKKGQDLEHIL